MKFKLPDKLLNLLPKKGSPSPLAGLEKIPKKALFIAMAALGALIIGVAVFLFILIGRLNELAARPETTAPEAVGSSQFTANGANYIYLDITRSTPNTVLRLTKMVSDSLATIFFFDGGIDCPLFEIKLSDENGTLYALDSSFGGATAKNKTNLVFSPLPEGCKLFTLSLRELSSGHEMTFALSLDKEISYPPAKWLDERQMLYSDGDFSLYLDGAALSSSGTRFEYSYEKAGGLELIMGEVKQSVRLTDSFGSVLPLREIPTSCYFAGFGVMAGRMDYQAVTNLSGRVRLGFAGITKKYDINKTIPLSALYNEDSTENPYTITAGGYDIVLERFGKKGFSYVLVLHTINRGFEGEVTDEGMENRVDNRLTCRLTISYSNGASAVIEGQVKSKRIGSDVVFDAVEAFIANGETGYMSMSLTLDYCEIPVPDFNYEIDLSVLPVSRPFASLADEQAMLRAFEVETGAPDKTEFAAQIVTLRRFGDEYAALISAENHQKDGVSLLYQVTAVIKDGVFRITNITPLS